MTSQDVRLLFALFGQPYEQDSLVSGKLASDVVMDFTHMEVTALSGEVDGNKFSGELLVSFSGAPLEVKGNLNLDSMSFPWLARFYTGSRELADNETWSQEPFDFADFEIFSGQVDFESDQLVISPELILSNTEFSLIAVPTRISVEGFTGRLVGGNLTGSAEIGVSDSRAVFKTGFKLEGGSIKELFDSDGARAVATGGFTLNGALDGAGRSWLGIISSLKGSGSYEVLSGEVSELDPTAFARIVESADQNLDLADEKIHNAFAGYLEAGSFSFEGLLANFLPPMG